MHPVPPEGGNYRTERNILPALLVLACAVYFVALGNSAIWDANEAFYVETPREMLEANDFVNPTFNYLPRFNKPVLSYWIVAGFYGVFGVSVAVQRFAIALGAMIIIGCAFILASVSAGSREREAGSGKPEAGSGKPEAGSGKLEAGLWAAVGLAAAPRLMMFARRIFIDIWITAFMSLTLVFFALSERYPERRRLYLSLMYVAVGFGVLTKGPVAIALPALAFGLYLAVHRELRRITEMMLPLGVLIIAIIVVPWYATLYNEHGWMYIRSFFISENIERFTSGVGVRQPRGPLFYFPVVLSDSFPWSLLLFAAAAAWKQRSRVETLLWCWIAAIVGFFSLSAGKQDLYIFPIVAAVAGLGGAAIQRGLAVPGWGRWVTGTVAVTGLLLALAGAAVLALFQTAGRVYALDSALIVGAIGLAGGIVTTVLAFARKPAAAAMALLAAVIAVNWVFVVRALPEFERYKPVPEMSALLQERLRPGDAVAHYRVALPSMVYYLRRHIETFESREEFLAFMRRHHTYAVLRADEYRDIAGELPPGSCVVGEWQFFQAKLKDVLAHRPLPKLVLMDTRCPPR
jgi:4-amino-4-deoxy-L-arabinose transferase-like glycosyltransferase